MLAYSLKVLILVSPILATDTSTPLHMCAHGLISMGRSTHIYLYAYIMDVWSGGSPPLPHVAGGNLEYNSVY